MLWGRRPCTRRTHERCIEGARVDEEEPCHLAPVLDIGGVPLSNGWDHHARKRAAATFKLDWVEMETRHRLIFETYKEGRRTLEEYLRLVIFREKRSIAAFRKFRFAQSRPYAEMIAARLEERHAMRIVVVSNEWRKLNAHRVRTFKLDQLVDAFI